MKRSALAITVIVVTIASLVFAFEDKKGEKGDRPVEKKKVDERASASGMFEKLAANGIVLSEQQKAQAKPLIDKHERNMAELKERMSAEQRRFLTEFGSVLDEEQKARWKELTGGDKKKADGEAKKKPVEGDKKPEGEVKKKPAEGEKKPEGEVKKKPAEGDKKPEREKKEGEKKSDNS